MALTGAHMAVPGKGVPQPTEIKLHQASRILEIAYADGRTYRLPCEFLRVFSPSAERTLSSFVQPSTASRKSTVTSDCRGMTVGGSHMSLKSVEKKIGL